MTQASYIHPVTAAVWTGPAPTHAAWDRTTQRFAYVIPEGAQPADPHTTSRLQAHMLNLLDAPPKARQPYKDGFITKPPVRLACPTCQSANIQVPLTTSVDPQGDLLAWFGKGTCSCPDCGYTGMAVKQKGYTMYEYSDLVRERAEFLQTLQASIPQQA